MNPLAWANTKLVARDPVEAVREMKAAESGSMRTIGSLTLCRSLLTAALQMLGYVPRILRAARSRDR